MNKIVAFSALSLLLSSSAMAQDQSTSGEQITLPAACEEAASKGGNMDMSQSTDAMQDMMANMDDVQMANMKAMMAMHRAMMQAMTIKDPDLAFNCGMIPHHQGAIAMAEAELKMGKDEESRKLAQTIIDAQNKEIAEMTAWVEKHAK
ncbi:MAG TPA: DUF305 domain-containing protein [Dongiaceae bacterium]